MSALRLSHVLAAATVGLLLVASFPTPAAAQGCTAHTCTAVNHVQVTVPTRLGLNAAGPGATVRANTAWRLEVNALAPGVTVVAAGNRERAEVTEIRDNPGPSAVAVRYTLVGS